MDCPHSILQETITKKGFWDFVLKTRKQNALLTGAESQCYLFLCFVVVEFSWTVLISFRSPVISCFVFSVFKRVCV